MRLTSTKYKCKCGREFDTMEQYSYHFEEGKKKIGKLNGEKVQYGVENKVLEGKSVNDQLISEYVFDHQILRTGNEEYNRW